MNRWQRVSAGVKGAIENTLDDLRHTWEKAWFGEKITGEVNMFPMEKETENQGNFYQTNITNNFYNYEPPEQGGREQGQDIDR